MKDSADNTHDGTYETNERFDRSDITKDKDITDVALKEKNQFNVSMTKLSNTKQNEEGLAIKKANQRKLYTINRNFMAPVKE